MTYCQHGRIQYIEHCQPCDRALMEQLRQDTEVTEKNRQESADAEMARQLGDQFAEQLKDMRIAAKPVCAYRNAHPPAGAAPIAGSAPPIPVAHPVAMQYHPTGHSQFTYGLTRACTSLAVRIGCAILKRRRWDWCDVDCIMVTETEPDEHCGSEVFFREDIYSLARVVDQAEIKNGAATKRFISDIGNGFGCLVIGLGYSFGVVRVNDSWVLVDTHAQNGRGMIYRTGSLDHVIGDLLIDTHGLEPEYLVRNAISFRLA